MVIKEIVFYITGVQDRVQSGNPTCLFIPDDAERQKIVDEICRSLLADAIKLSNGDFMIVTGTD